MSTEPIQAMLQRLGIREHPEQAKAVAALQETGVISSRPNRTGIDRSKEALVRKALYANFLLHCRRGNCQQEAAASIHPTLLVDDGACQTANHSPRTRLLSELDVAMTSKGWTNILMVGGTDKYEQEILDASPDGLSWRFIDGKKVKDARFYQPHKAWAHLIVIWASTPLDHKVSQNFSSSNDPRVVTAPGRGIEAMLQDILRLPPLAASV